MTTTVKVHVNGRYKATVKHDVDGKIVNTIEVGPQEEKSFNLHHDGENSFHVVEERLSDEEPKGGIPAEGFSAQAAAAKDAE